MNFNMKVIKRDGRAVDYDRNKIITAIEKANQEVNSIDKVTMEEIKGIVLYIEELHKKRILVEDIQDIIEERLMELKKYELAKKYIVYRYTRALVRKQNTTDETILGIIRNENIECDKNYKPMYISEQRNFIAGEISRDLTKRLLLPEKIAKAEEDGVLYFHNADYFVHPMIDSSIVNISDILKNGTVINGENINTPSSFLTAIMITTQVLAAGSNNQYGGQSIDMMHFGKYLKATYDSIKEQIYEEQKMGPKNEIINEKLEQLVKNRVEMELKQSIQILKYQISALNEVNGRKNDITLFLHLEKDDNYIKENAQIIEEILKQKNESSKKEEKDSFKTMPKLVYVLDEFNSLNGRRI